MEDNGIRDEDTGRRGKKWSLTEDRSVTWEPGTSRWPTGSARGLPLQTAQGSAFGRDAEHDRNCGKPRLPSPPLL